MTPLELREEARGFREVARAAFAAGCRNDAGEWYDYANELDAKATEREAARADGRDLTGEAS